VRTGMKQVYSGQQSAVSLETADGFKLKADR
jgi:hypothetical protein